VEQPKPASQVAATSKQAPAKAAATKTAVAVKPKQKTFAEIAKENAPEAKEARRLAEIEQARLEEERRRAEQERLERERKERLEREARQREEQRKREEEERLRQQQAAAAAAAVAEQERLLAEAAAVEEAHRRQQEEEARAAAVAEAHRVQQEEEAARAAHARQEAEERQRAAAKRPQASAPKGYSAWEATSATQPADYAFSNSVVLPPVVLEADPGTQYKFGHKPKPAAAEVHQEPAQPDDSADAPAQDESQEVAQDAEADKTHKAGATDQHQGHPARGQEAHGHFPGNFDQQQHAQYFQQGGVPNAGYWQQHQRGGWYSGGEEGFGYQQPGPEFAHPSFYNGGARAPHQGGKQRNRNNQGSNRNNQGSNQGYRNKQSKPDGAHVAQADPAAKPQGQRGPESRNPAQTQPFPAKGFHKQQQQQPAYQQPQGGQYAGGFPRDQQAAPAPQVYPAGKADYRSKGQAGGFAQHQQFTHAPGYVMPGYAYPPQQHYYAQSAGRYPPHPGYAPMPYGAYHPYGFPHPQGGAEGYDGHFFPHEQPYAGKPDSSEADVDQAAPADQPKKGAAPQADAGNRMTSPYHSSYQQSQGYPAHGQYPPHQFTGGDYDYQQGPWTGHGEQ